MLCYSSVLEKVYFTCCMGAVLRYMYLSHCYNVCKHLHYVVQCSYNMQLLEVSVQLYTEIRLSFHPQILLNSTAGTTRV